MKLLEIGCGNSPAMELGGRLFHEESVEYIGVDVTLPPRLQALTAGKFIRADITAAPELDDESFDVVLARNYFGQFCDGATPLNVANKIIRATLHEVYRVLKPLGRMAVVEENTPMDAEDLTYELRALGFRKDEFVEMRYGVDNLQPHSSWSKLRSRYYNDVPVQSAPDEWLGEPYVLVATKK